MVGFGESWNFLYKIFSILVKENPYGFYSSTRGVRQGDPLSLMLFILVMEALSRMIDKVVAARYLRGGLL